MNGSAENTNPGDEANPFSSRYVRPGALPFVFTDGADLATVLTRFDSHGRRGQIIGKHGSGKSTLLAALTAALVERGDRVNLVVLHDGGQGDVRAVDEALAGASGGVLAIDGFEQLGWIVGLRVRKATQRAGRGLLVTAHRSRGLPTIFKTHPSEALAVQLAGCLMAAHAPAGRRHAIVADDVRRGFTEHRGDLRETFFGLYDLYELRRS